MARKLDDQLDDKELYEFLKRFQQTYEESDPGWFDMFAPDATFFTVSSPTRIDSTEEYRRGFEPYFTAGVKRRAQILSPDVRVVGSVASVTLHNRVSVDGVTQNFRGTVIIQQGDRGLEITHLHWSPLSAPDVVNVGRPDEAVTLLEERVATAAATVGTPK